jgi:hypothetical protein
MAGLLPDNRKWVRPNLRYYPSMPEDTEENKKKITLTFTVRYYPSMPEDTEENKKNHYTDIHGFKRVSNFTHVRRSGK